jgi:hypothetical protein
MDRHDELLRGSESADFRKGICGFVAFSCVVVPVKLAGFLALSELVRAVAERLVLRQSATTEILFLATDNQLVRLESECVLRYVP